MDHATHSLAGRIGMYKLRERRKSKRKQRDNGLEAAHLKIVAQRREGISRLSMRYFCGPRDLR
jgi:hypothetical protein